MLVLPLCSAVEMFSLQTKSTVQFGQSRDRFSSCFWRLLHIPERETSPRRGCVKRKSWCGKKVVKNWPNPIMFLLILCLLVGKTTAQSARSCAVLHLSQWWEVTCLKLSIYLQKRNQSSNWLYLLTWCSQKNYKYYYSAYQERCFDCTGKDLFHHLTSKTYSWKMKAKPLKKCKFRLE